MIVGGLAAMFCLTGALQAQRRPYFVLFQQEHFFGPVPSPRSEAMASADVAIGGAATSVWYNPAGIGTVADWSADLTTAGPFYVLRASDYAFAGFARRLHPKLTAALSLNRLAVGPTSFQIDIDGQDFEMDAPTVNDLIATVAATPLPGLHLGVNAHFFTFRPFDDVRASRTFYADAGALYVRRLPDRSELRLGASLVNFTYADLTLRSPIGTEASNVFPVIGRAGVAYERSLALSVPGAGSQPLRMLLTAEYQDLLNSPYRTTLRFGSEWVLAEVLALRLGFFTQSANDFGIANNRSRVNDATYGFGIHIPVSRISGGKWPVHAQLDYYALESPPQIFSGSRQPNKRGFGLRIVADLPSHP
ncbi:MAG: hypothetical protein OHK0039_32410 [Bacteroidia bacterium]